MDGLEMVTELKILRSAQGERCGDKAGETRLRGFEHAQRRDSGYWTKDERCFSCLNVV